MAALADSRFGEPRFLASVEFPEALLRNYPNRQFQVRLWTGTVLSDPSTTTPDWRRALASRAFWRLPLGVAGVREWKGLERTF